jgi:hypothetical protein
MGRPPIGQKAMTGAERQRRHRDFVTAGPMTKSEREDLVRLIRNREKVMKTAASQRSAELLAEFEQQIASVYRYDQDETWKAAHQAAATAVKQAQQTVLARCGELGIPARFAPEILLSWRGRGENAISERRAELRAVAKSRIAAIEKAACTKIEMTCLDAQTRILAHGLTSTAAIDFFDNMPSIEMLMPPIEMTSVEEMLRERRTGRLHYQPA